MPPNTPSVIPTPEWLSIWRRMRTRDPGTTNRLEQRERDIFADDGGDLEEAFVLLSKPVDARWRHHLDGGRELDRLGRLHQPILSALPRQLVRFHQRPTGMAPACSNGEEAAEFRDGMARVLDLDATRGKRFLRY